MMTPQEVANCTFAKSVMGGYNMASVDDFLDKLTEDYSALYKENAALKAKLKVTVDKMAEYRESEDAIRSTLLAAQKMSTAMLSEAEQKRNKMIADASADAQKHLTELRQQIAEEERRLSSVQFQVDKELEAERKRLVVGQEQLRAFIKEVRAVCNEELAQLELLPELPVEEPAPEPVIQIARPAVREEEAPAPAAGGAPAPEGEDFTHDDLLQAISAFAPAGPAAGEPEEAAEGDPFAEDGLEEDASATRVINLDELQFGPNYKKE